MSRLLSRTVAAARQVAASKNLEFHFSQDDNLPGSVGGDGSRVQQVLYNLISNGIKYSESGFVSLRVAPLFVWNILLGMI